MSTQAFEYARGRFVNPSRIVESSIYTKANPKSNEPNQPEKLIRVAMRIDVREAAKDVIYSDPFATEDAARQFIMSIPVS